MAMATLQCYNKGCGQKFNPDENADEACQYHPGAPIFHDAYKGWSCCNKRSTDFTTFLNTKGCATGRHNPEKPAEPEKPKIDPAFKDEVITVDSKKTLPSLPRPPLDTPLSRLPVTVSQSLRQALEKKAAEEHPEGEDSEEDEEKNVDGVKMGESCKNNGCKSEYEGEHSNLELCKFHPGVPVFHEGLKYWSCCKKKSTDFSEFLAQLGCSTGHHCWVKLETRRVTACRYDWHQTGTHVFVSVYAKLAVPATTYVEVNPIKLKANIVFGDQDLFELDLELEGLIDVDQSSVTLAASKVEIKLRKGEPRSWRNLNTERIKPSENKTDDEKAEEVEMEERVDAIDLSDI